MARSARRLSSSRRVHVPRLRDRERRRRLATIAIVAVGFVAVAALLVSVSRLSTDARHATAEGLSGPAPGFTLPSVSGEEVSLDSYRDRKNVLLFFNEGYGCAPCWQQSVEIQARLDELTATDTEYLVVTVDPGSLARSEVERWDLTVPVLFDPGRSVASAYKTLGFGMHSDKPNHTFVFVDKAGEIQWWQDYPSMRAPTDEVIAKVRALSEASRSIGHPGGTS